MQDPLDRQLSPAEVATYRRGACDLVWMWELERIAAEVGVHLDDVVTEDLRLRAEEAMFVWRFGREMTDRELIEQLAGESGQDEDELWAQYLAIEASEPHGHR